METRFDILQGYQPQGMNGSGSFLSFISVLSKVTWNYGPLGRECYMTSLLKVLSCLNMIYENHVS